MVSEEQVRKWLAQQDVEATQAELDEDEEEAHWALVFRVPGRYQTLVVHRKVEYTNIAMQTSINVSPDHQEALRKADEDRRDRFIYDLRIKLLETPVGHSLEFSEDEPKICTRAWFGLQLFEENVTRAGFFRRHHQIQSAATLTAVMLQKFERFPEW